MGNCIQNRSRYRPYFSPSSILLLDMDGESASFAQFTNDLDVEDSTMTKSESTTTSSVFHQTKPIEHGKIYDDVEYDDDTINDGLLTLPETDEFDVMNPNGGNEKLTNEDFLYALPMYA